MSTPLGSAQWMYASETGYQIEDSLRFEDGSSAYLNRTPAAAGNRKTWTWSAWVKRGNLGSAQYVFFAYNGNSDAGFFRIEFNSTNTLRVRGWGTTYLETSALYRDTSAWYHIVLVADTTQSQTSSTASDSRIRLYVNGERVTAFSSTSMPSQNTDLPINNNIIHNLSSSTGYLSSSFFDGYLSDINFIDGQALDPTDFGETIDGYWRPVAYSGTYGTNGFHLEFDGAVTDSSGNGNDWTANNISAHDYVPDSPTNNFATYNINVNTGQSLTYEEGNLNNSASGSFWSSSVWQQSSLGITGGANAEKYYFEYCTTTSGSGQATGVAVQSSRAIDTVSHNDGVIYYNTSVKTGNTVTVSGISNNPTYDVLRFAFDASNGKVWIGNSTGWFNSGDPAAGTGESGTIANYDGSVLVAVTNRTTITSDHIFNFGQDSTFAGFKASGSANGSDNNGIGDFYYAVPAGFLALCTANLPTPTIVDGSEYFVPYLYTADNTSPRSFTGLGFEPDVLWFKTRSQSFSHRLFNSTVGVGSHQYTDRTDNATWDSLVSFDADGFTVEADGTAGNLLNYSTSTYVAWAWKTGTTVSGNTTGAGTAKAYTGSVNTDSGISVISYKGNGTAGHTIPHHLGKAPSMVMTKKTTATGSFGVYHSGLTSASYYILLNDTTAEASNNVYFNGTAPDATVVTRGTGADGNANDVDYVQFSFAEIDGYSKIGSFTGNSNVDGAFVYTGFRPSFVLFRSAAIGANWYIVDNKRDPHNVVTKYLRPAIANAEGSLAFVDFLSNGFKLRSSSTEINGTNVIYLAFAETPFKYANAR